MISTLLATRLPGLGVIFLDQTLAFRGPVTEGDTITTLVTVRAKDSEDHRITLDCRCVNQRGEAVITGGAVVIAPTEKVKRPQGSATWRHDLSADPGTKTEGGGTMPPCLLLRDWYESGKSVYLCECSLYLVFRPRFLHFTVNHDIRSRPAHSDHFFFAFRHFCEMAANTLWLVSRVLSLGPRYGEVDSRL